MRKWLLLAVLLCLLPNQATAHLVSTRFGELYSGILHPLTSLLHLVPWLALGLLGGTQNITTARWALLVFPLAVLTGLAFADGLPVPTFVQALNIASFIVIGLLLALKWELSKASFLSLVGLFGLTHGYANAAPELNGFDWLLYGLGVGLTAYVLITLVSASTQALVSDQGWRVIVVRAAGSWIAAAGVMYAGLWFTRP
ncbi:MAG: HupE/UreJ family protein [Candidatus Competibacteraceae bacterium]|jgi:hydrogenase/urease accessory protein HupE|nr:HupE/UreJ family protein [Candidatus Competibacteraceae bacterium]